MDVWVSVVLDECIHLKLHSPTQIRPKEIRPKEIRPKDFLWAMAHKKSLGLI